MAFLREPPPDDKFHSVSVFSAFTAAAAVLTFLGVVIAGAIVLLRAEVACRPAARPPHFAPPAAVRPELRPGLTRSLA